MILTRTSLKGFKNFKDETNFRFDKINLIKGKNGSGKSTLSNDCILFCLWGYSSQTLEKLATRSLKKKEFRVRQEWEIKGKKLIIERYYPTSLIIYENGVKLLFPTTSEAQLYLNRLFKDLEYFKKFRMIDTKEGINILEEGKTSVKKTLLSLQEVWFNTVRQRLLDKKREREVYSKDRTVWKHFPSATRLDVLKKAISEISTEYSTLSKSVNNQNRLLTEMTYKSGKIQSKAEIYQLKLEEVSKLNVCPTCTQEIPEEVKGAIQTRLVSDISQCLDEVSPIEKEIESEREVIKELEKLRETHNLNLVKLQELKSRLETAIKQKDFKWSRKDVLVIDRCIKELDNFYNYFISEWLRTLVPIMNNVLEKIGFKITFKDDFDIVLHKDGQEYSYKDLSNGQRLILSIALKIAILLEKNEEGLIIADEGFSSLDDENLDYILKLFEDFPFQLIAIIHRFSGENEEHRIISL